MWKPDRVVRKRLFTAVAMVTVATLSGVTVITAQAAGSAGRAAITTATDTSYLTVGAMGVSRHTAAPIDTQALPARAALAPKYDCAAIAQQDFSQVKNAPTTILSATLATAKSATGTSYQYCDVSGIVYPQVQFELQLPTTTYSGRYLQEGCGGYCGHVGVNQPAASGQAGIDECVPLNNGQFALG
jgi:feruloyl esterase